MGGSRAVHAGPAARNRVSRSTKEKTMYRLLLAARAAAVLARASGPDANARADEKPKEKGHVHEHFDKCAKACADCQLSCDSCFNHCAALVAKGDKDHVKTMHTCVDCAECCKLAATLTA